VRRSTVRDLIRAGVPVDGDAQLQVAVLAIFSALVGITHQVQEGGKQQDSKARVAIIMRSVGRCMR